MAGKGEAARGFGGTISDNMLPASAGMRGTHPNVNNRLVSRTKELGTPSAHLGPHTCRQLPLVRTKLCILGSNGTHCRGPVARRIRVHQVLPDLCTAFKTRLSTTLKIKPPQLRLHPHVMYNLNTLTSASSASDSPPTPASASRCSRLSSSGSTDAMYVDIDRSAPMSPLPTCRGGSQA
eukprot:354734-Chlamydomonas_euryale.AAC.12